MHINGLSWLQREFHSYKLFHDRSLHLLEIGRIVVAHVVKLHCQQRQRVCCMVVQQVAVMLFDHQHTRS